MKSRPKSLTRYLPKSSSSIPIQAGFTLVELLITIAILSIIMAAVTNLLISSTKVYQSNNAVLRMQQDVRVARSLLVNDFKRLGVLSAIDDSELTGEEYIFLMDGNDFVRKEVVDLSKKRIIMSEVGKVEFKYLNSVGDYTTVPADVRTIEIEVCGKVPPGTPLLSENFQHCIIDSAVIRNAYY